MTLWVLHTHTHTHRHTHTRWCYLWGIRVVEVTYHCLPWPAVCPLWSPLVKFPEASWLRIDPVSLDMVYASTLGSLAAWSSTQWEIARECSFIYRVSTEMIWLQLVWNVGICSSGFNIVWSYYPESEGTSGGTRNWKSSSEKPSPRSSRMLPPHPQSRS
jgi:hypothetical protein